jgi:hypothetical protein
MAVNTSPTPVTETALKTGLLTVPMVDMVSVSEMSVLLPAARRRAFPSLSTVLKTLGLSVPMFNRFCLPLSPVVRAEVVA